jgi:Aspartyl protease
MKFPYAQYGNSYMPVIPVTISRGEQSFVTEALVDSGAASSMFDAEIAGLLGITDLENDGIRLEFEGVSGHRVVGYQHDVTLEVGGNRFHAVPIAFTRDMPDNAVNILGQQGFFEIFPIKFTYRIKEIDLMMGVL